MSDDIKFKPDIKRLSEMVSVEQYWKLREADIDAELEVLCQFVVGDDGDYLSAEDGRKQVGKLKLASVQETFNQFMAEAEAFAVPLAKSKD